MEKDQIFILEDRGVLYINGKDAKEFLQNIVTNDMEKVDDNFSCFATLLSPQGKYLFDFIIIKHKQGYFIDCEKNQIDQLYKRLDFYKLRSEVEILNLSNEFVIAVLSRKKFLALKNAKDFEGATLKYLGDPIFLDPRIKDLGGRLIINLEKLDKSLKELNLNSQDPMKYYEFSHQLGVPQINTVKLQDKIFGIECNFEELNGIDFSKGCYVGQENTARMKLRNKVRRRLFPLSVCKELSLDGEILYNEKKVGKILINKPFPFALIKLFDPDLVEFANKDLSSNNSKIKLIRSSFLLP
tara:strand:+ start:1153 stop:2046 length:894 start_codon:yes stop_codon:yes gene_type:complete